MSNGQSSSEALRRPGMWGSLLAAGGPRGVVPGLLRDLRIYGGAQGVWVDKDVTGHGARDGAGIALGVLHNGTSYKDDLSDDGVIYHFPRTTRRGLCSGKQDGCERQSG
jgi:hypothetical protein